MHMYPYGEVMLHKKIDIFKLQKFESLDLATAYTIYVWWIYISKNLNLKPTLV